VSTVWIEFRGKRAGAVKVVTNCSTQTYFHAFWALLFFVMFFKHYFAVQRFKKRITELEAASLAGSFNRS